MSLARQQGVPDASKAYMGAGVGGHIPRPLVDSQAAGGFL